MKSFSFRTKSYLFMTWAVGIVIFASRIQHVDLGTPLLLLALCVLASLAEILKVAGSTERSHYTFSFLIYGFTFALFGPTEAMLVIVVAHLVEWIWNRPPWYIQLFNTGSYVLVMEAASLVYSWINPARVHTTWQAALAIIISMAAFNMLNHLMVALVIWLARGEDFKKSGIFDFFPLMLDLTLLYFGASLSLVWNYNPYALGFFLVPLYLIYSTLRVPALERQTEIDGKTDLFNHEYFRKQLNGELARANRFDHPLSIIMADLDLLRNINSTYGHLAGDEILKGVASLMKTAVRDYDVVSRFGGEEFAILLPETRVSQAYARAEMIRTAIESAEFTVPTSITPIRVTMSFGVSQRENFSQTPDDIIHNADLALYHSKLKGRNRSFAYSNEAYVDFLISAVEATVSGEHPEQVRDAAAESTSPESFPAEPPSTEPYDSGRGTDAGKTGTPQGNGKSPASRHAVGVFTGALALLSLLSFAAIVHWMPSTVDGPGFDWLGLTTISVLIVLSEGFSIDLYARQTSISTSAIPILVTYLIFGPIGVALASVVLALSLVLKYHSPFSRFVFNFSNHLLAGTLCVGLVLLAGGNFLGLTPPYQIVTSLVAAAIMYLTTSWMVACGMSLDLGLPALQIWKEQFSWLAAYYMGIGFTAYALIFGYGHDHIVGLIVMLAPMLVLRASQKQYIDRTRQVVAELREKNQILKKNSEEIAQLNEGLLVTLSEIIELRDPYILGHSKQVTKYAMNIATRLGLNEKRIQLIRKAALLHDIGKLGIPTEILSKPGVLSPQEYAVVKQHAALGGDLVENSPSFHQLVPIIRHHHEHYNGSGYPDRLAGHDVSIEARILAVADAIDAMLSDRPYRKALPVTKVIQELYRGSGSQFDPLLVDEAIKMLGASATKESVVPDQAVRLQSILDQHQFAEKGFSGLK